MTTLDRTREILGELISFPTISSAGNLALITYAADLLSAAGANISISRDFTGKKANLFATLGPPGDGGIVLSGHTDVVPVDGQEWSSDPFRMDCREERLYGRGACDMKGFIASCLAMAPAFAETELTRPLHFAFTYDEEVGCLGARSLMAEIAQSGIHPSVAIIGEPTGMRVIEGHKGCYEYTTEFFGMEGHASQPDLGVNAIEYAVQYISRLMEIGDMLKGRAPKESCFDPPWTTVQAGRIYGGAARNVIAGHCAVEWEMRPVTSADADFVRSELHEYAEKVLKPAMLSVCPQAGIVTHTIGEVEGLAIVPVSEARNMLLELTNSSHAEIVPFGTEAGLFQSAGISAIICGPGSIAQAHKPDEFIETAQLAACLEMLDRLRLKHAAQT